MRIIHRRFLSYVVLATYAGISFLGEGLHELMPEAGHHHHDGLYIVHCASDPDHDVGHGGSSPSQVVTRGDTDVDSHLCEICAFLFQTVSQPVEIAPPIHWQPLVVAAPPEPQPIYTPTSLGVQAPRGPPVLS